MEVTEERKGTKHKAEEEDAEELVAEEEEGGEDDTSSTSQSVLSSRQTFLFIDFGTYSNCQLYSRQAC